jgi:glutathione S-transferase
MAEIGRSAPVVEIVGRSSSLFTRVTTLFAETLGLSWRLKPLADMTVLDADAFAGNPALKIPVLRIDGEGLFGTENICRALARQAAERQRIEVVWSEDLPNHLSRNGQELVWHCMAAQVQLVMGTVIGGLPAESPFFVKTRVGMEASLRWLDSNVDRIIRALPAGRDASLFEITLFCLIEHLAFRPTVPVRDYQRLGDFAVAFGASDAARATAFRFDQ